MKDRGQPGTSKPSLRQRLGAMRARGETFFQWLEDSRPRHRSVEVAFQGVARDKAIAGGVLGGGLAYRFFFWVLSFTVISAGGLGIASSARKNVEAAAAEAGLNATLASSIADAAEQSEAGRWWLVFIGAVSLIWFSWGLLRALRLVHAAAWGVRLEPLRGAPRAVAAVIITPVVVAALTAGAGWVRANPGGVSGLIATLAVSLGFGAIWLLVSMRLPSADVPWTAYLPGAIVFGIGLQALHLFTVYFLEAKLTSASQLYGVLGLSTTMLFYMFLIGRGVVWAAELNAVVWEVRHPPSQA